MLNTSESSHRLTKLGPGAQEIISKAFRSYMADFKILNQKSSVDWPMDKLKFVFEMIGTKERKNTNIC